VKAKDHQTNPERECSYGGEKNQRPIKTLPQMDSKLRDVFGSEFLETGWQTRQVYQGEDNEKEIKDSIRQRLGRSGNENRRGGEKNF